MIYRLIIIGLLICSNSILIAQRIDSFRERKNEIQAEEYRQVGLKLFEDRNFYAAADNFQKIEELEQTTAEDTWHLAESYRMLNRYQQALNNYTKLQAEQYPTVGFYQAQMQMSLEQYDEAIDNFKAFLKNDGASKLMVAEAREKIKWCEEAKQILKKPGNQISTVNRKALNGYSGFGFGAVNYQGKLIFTGVERVKVGKTLPVGEVKVVFDSLYVNRMIDGERGIPLDVEPVDDHYSIGSPTFTSDGNKVYFTQCEDAVEKNCEIYSATKEKDRWSKPKREALINIDSYNSKHPMLAQIEQNTVLFFSSNRPGGEGNYDIWYARIDSNGVANNIKNLGTGVNTEENEITPFFDSSNGHFFFSSNGLKSLGGYDVFMVKMNPNLTSGKVFNLGKPINSGADDIYFYLKNADTNGYLTSNREEGCCDNIYDITFELPFNYNQLPNYMTEVDEFAQDDASFALAQDEFFNYKNLGYEESDSEALVVSDVDITGDLFSNDTPLSNTTVYLTDDTGSIIDSTTTDDAGKFAFRSLPGGEQYFYTLAADDA
ncbi:carboxypeptidase regulatory-like domain-containing protein, partial [Fulvivirga sp. RKSG066]|uniref:carboxypeptidase-like regulatory domain-containing protein n=1 Tax=Fulvivirga aurantia TaxID=2529383 RepID=UPI0012BCB23B